jgi:hypothetical protein
MMTPFVSKSSFQRLVASDDASHDTGLNVAASRMTVNIKNHFFYSIIIILLKKYHCTKFDDMIDKRRCIVLSIR